ncbi:tetratricopeptide repeat protein [Paenibacillus sp. alder61]|uniref:Tetratricopeptide repeat protein n=1 Tax=Paenibacillus faecis TaxID=862114 RepID=A0A5D0D4D1_9BACL|nr:MULTISPECIES: J domain-containing protein [Paenibacillus]MCA1293854.1 tetratricopeptide repeat protein [Paenibacillus sp. alder61]TYA15435.1 tetratricopeptide repeat protein [Paenibacillus faecis]
MTIWERLGLPPTTDMKAIKRAYARQLKVYHPEDDPAGYQALREAFDAAVGYAKKGAPLETAQNDEDWVNAEMETETEPTRETDLVLPRIRLMNPEAYPEPNSNREPDLVLPKIRLMNPEAYPEPNSNREPDLVLPKIRVMEMPPVAETDPAEANLRAVAEWIDRAAALYDDFPARISAVKWEELLHSETVWNLDTAPVVSAQLLSLLQTRRYLPTEVWQILEKSFGWLRIMEASDEYDPDLHADSFLLFYQRQLQSGFRFDSLLRTENVEIDRFLELRDLGHQALVMDHIPQAEQYLQSAYALFADDPDLLRLLGECCFRKNYYKKALDYFNRLIEIMPDEIDGYWYRAKLLHYKRDYAPLLEECKSILARWPDHEQARLLMAHAFLALGKKVEGISLVQRMAEVHHPASGTQSIPNRTKWRRFVNRKIVTGFVLALTAHLLLIGLLISSWNTANARIPISVKDLQAPNLISEQRYVELPNLDLKKLEVGEYVLNEQRVFEYKPYAFLRFDQYGDPERYIYLGEISGMPIIFLSETPLELAKEKRKTPLRGYLYPSNPELGLAVAQSLQWESLYSSDDAIGRLAAYSRSLNNLDAKAAEELAPSELAPFVETYFEVRGPIVETPYNRQFVFQLGILVFLGILGVYKTVFEYIRIRRIR